MKNKNIQIITLNQKNIKNFAEARNKLLKKATKDWVLFLDKDEKISNLNFSISEEFTSYEFVRKNYFIGQYIGEDKIIRLVKKGTGKWVRRVHEFWVPSKGKIGKINTLIIHNTADNLKDYITKINFYSDLHAQANKSEGKKSTPYKIVLFPILKFMQTLIKSKNVTFSIMQAFHSFLSWSKQYLFFYS